VRESENVPDLEFVNVGMVDKLTLKDVEGKVVADKDTLCSDVSEGDVVILALLDCERERDDVWDTPVENVMEAVD
jgi:hypothetical protein